MWEMGSNESLITFYLIGESTSTFKVFKVPETEMFDFKQQETFQKLHSNNFLKY